MRVRLLSLLLLAAVCAGCGGGDPESPQPSPGNTDGRLQIRGNQRIAWDQEAASLQDLQQNYTFVLFDNNTRTTLTGVRCEAGTGAAFVCSGQLQLARGDHDLEVAAVVGGVESARSSPPLRVTVTAAASTAALSELAPLEAGARAACAGDTCFDSRVVAVSDSNVDELVATADGRIIFVEDRRRVRVVLRDRVFPTPALVIDDGARVVGLAAGAEEDAQTIYIAIAEDNPGRLPEAAVWRYRELEGLFGEGAAILASVPIPPDAVVPLAVDDFGFVYAALPASDPGGGRTTWVNGDVIRVTRDGRTPSSHASGLPGIGEGFQSPTSLAVDRLNGRIWLAGTHPGWQNRVATLPIGESQRQESARLPFAVPGIDSALGEPRLALTGAAGERRLLIASQGRLLRGRVSDAGGVADLQDLPLEGDVTAVSGAPDGSIAVAVASPDGRSRVLSLTPR